MQTDTPRWHNRPVALPARIFFVYNALRGARCLHVDEHMAAGAAAAFGHYDEAIWIGKHPQTWQHAVLYGAERAS